MYLANDIIKEGNEILREKAKDVSIPLNKEDLEILTNLHEYVVCSQIDELAKKFKIRPGVGIAAPQVGKSKRMFAIEVDDFLDNNKHYSFSAVNPRIISRSKELTYLPGGEGCLSVDRPTNGVTPRNYKILVKGYFYDFITKKLQFKTLELEGYPAIVFQHEYDHLDGIMYVDKLYDEKNIDIEPLFTYEEDEQVDNK
jgi:peptide deformylase